MPNDIKSRVAFIKEQIAEAADRSGRLITDIKILAATKTRNIQEIIEALNSGVDIVGENRIQEALSKFEFLPQKTEKHLIGSLQPNKVRTAIQLFDLIQSVNSIELAQSINKEAQTLGITFPILIEVNPADEETKSGASLDSIDALIEEVLLLEKIELRGLMAMLPYDQDAETLKPAFAAMRSKFEKLRETLNEDFNVLSMGMSNDYITAVEEGSTMIRLGTTIFGPRAR